jgi:hypothetical protein
MSLEDFLEKHSSHKTELDKQVEFLKNWHHFDDNKIIDILNDFFFLFGSRHLNIFHEAFEGIFENFQTFAREFHEDIENEDVCFDDEYILDLEEYYIFCDNSQAVFRDIVNNDLSFDDNFNGDS